MLFILLSLLVVRPDTVTPAQAFAELDSISANPRTLLWGRPLVGPMLFVDPDTRSVYANRPGIPATLPDSVGMANTSVYWNGRRWAMVLLPLPDNRDRRLNLLLHESFHRIQDSLGLPPRSPMAGYLDSRDGRLWLRLELRALARALADPVGRRAYDLQSALLFRAARYALHPGEDSIEHALEWNEGLAEFTGVYASGIFLQDTSYLPGTVRTDTIRPSFTRSFAYLTGPLYGILLSQRDPYWTRHVTPTDNFETEIRRVYGLPTAVSPASTGAAASRADASRADAYDGARLRAEEDARDARHQAMARAYRARLVDGPHLAFTTTSAMRIGFNPNNLFDLTPYGIVYPNMTMTDAWGSLEATDGVLFKDWKYVSLALDAATAASPAAATPAPGAATSAPGAPSTLHGPGWSLTLNPGWKLAPGKRPGDLTLIRVSSRE